MSSLNPPTPVSSVQAAQAATQARARSQSAGTAAHGGAAGASSPFAQMLQDLDEVSSAAVAAPEPAKAEPDDGGNGSAAPTDESAQARQPRPEDDSAAAAPPPPEQNAAALGQPGWLAAARARAALAAQATDLASRSRAGMQADASEAGLETHADPRIDATLGLGAASGEPGTLALDGAGWKPALDAASVNLAATPTETAAPAGAEFSLPSLGDAPAAPAPGAAAEPPPAQATLAPAPGSPAFPAALGAQLSTWLKDGVQHATLELNPQDMGPIDVHIALRDGRTLVELGADVAATRQALAEALPALAEALGDVGLSLDGGSVSDQTGQQGRPADAEGQRSFALPGWMAPAREGAGEAGAAAPQRVARGLVDLVA
jgi:flagellar hook-length control protein FliK